MDRERRSAIARVASVVVFGLVAAGCGGGGGGGNAVPTVNAGADLTALVGIAANLDATVTDDGNPSGTLTTTWSQVSGPGNVAFGNVAAVDTTATFSAMGVYVLRLTANDGSAAGTDEVTVTVGMVMDNADATFSVVEGTWDTAPTTDGNGCWGPDFAYAYSTPPDALARARFTPGLAAAASYDISAYWSAAENRTAAQPIIVHDASGADHTYTVSLRQNGNEWFPLGTLTLGPGSYIEFTTQTPSEGYCNADAIRLMPDGA